MSRSASFLMMAFGLAGLAGCASGLQAIGESLRYAAMPDQRVARASLNPQFEYLRARVNGRLAMLVLGYVDEQSSETPVQVFYSGEGETLKLQGGRIVGFSSPKQNVQIRIVSSKQPTWSLSGRSGFERQLDSRPDYRLSHTQQVNIERLAKPPGRRDLEGIKPEELIWFRETIQGASSGDPPTLFALRQVGGQLEVVYSEQCIAADLCLSLQRWRASGAY